MKENRLGTGLKSGSGRALSTIFGLSFAVAYLATLTPQDTPFHYYGVNSENPGQDAYPSSFSLSLTPKSAFANTGNGDDLLIVDCLLPGKVRRLGRKVTYVTRRRAVKAPASECEIRGGEYTSYDRANFATALKIWQPLAESGDPEAQTYVGEIYEKGLGTSPQPDLAAIWYRRAAEQGSSRAQISLGSLYERGLGVDQDMVKAVEWYRRASGLEATQLPYVPASVEQQLQELSQERQALSDERARLKQDRDQLAGERDALRRQLNAMQKKLQNTEANLKKQESLAENAYEALALANEALLKEKKKEAASIDRNEIKRLQDEIRKRRKEARLAEQQLAAVEEEADALSAQTTDMQSALEKARNAAAKLEKQQKQADADAVELDRLRKELATAEANSSKSAGALQEMRNKLDARESRVRDQNAQIEKLTKQLASTQKQAQQQQTQLVAIQKEDEAAKSVPPAIEIIDPPLKSLRSSDDSVEIKTRAVGERTVVGKVNAPGGLVALIVNDIQITPSDDGMFTQAVSLEFPRTSVNIVAIDGQGQRTQTRFSLIPEKRAQVARSDGDSLPSLKINDIPFGNYHALVIGNNNYRFIQPLETARNDAEVIGDILEKRYGFKTQVILDADRYRILSTLNKLREELTEDDNLLIYYAGHGALDRANDRGHWLPVDAEPDSSANWISNVQITDVLNAMTARQVMVVADSCYSGTLTRNAIAQLDSGMSNDARMNWIKQMASKRSRVVLSSGGIQPVLDSGGGDHSVFANAFINFLTSADNVFAGQYLFQSVSQSVSGSAAAGSIEQIPQFAPIKFAGHEAGDFFFVPQDPT